MKKHWKNWLLTVLFTLGGAGAGLTYYYLVGCATGSCPITASPLTTVAYTAFIGWLLSGVFRGGCCKNGCSR